MPFLMASLLLFAAVNIVGGILYCNADWYLELGNNEEDGHCEQCVEGTFIEDETHNKTFCERCTTYDENSQWYIMLAKCTVRSDTKRKCRPSGFFYDESHPHVPCQPCSICEQTGHYVGLDCSDFSDTVCCPQENMMVKNGTCIEFVRCGVGQYLVPDVLGSSGKSGTCKTCGANSTNFLDSHLRHTCQDVCLTIQYDSHNHRITRQSTCDPGEDEIGRVCGDGESVICERRVDTTEPGTVNVDGGDKKDVEKEQNWSSLKIAFVVLGILCAVTCIGLSIAYVVYNIRPLQNWWDSVPESDDDNIYL